MEVGVFAKTFERPSLDETLAAVAGHGLRAVQFNVESAGIEPMPEAIPDGFAEGVRGACAAHGVEIAALSGTFNMAHPEEAARRRGLDRFRVVAAACRRMGAATMTLCTGTRDPDNMWRRHPENDSPGAWRDLLATLEAALAVAEEHDLTLAFEPEPGNVVRDARRGAALLAEVGSPRLAIVMDAANIIDGEPGRPPDETLAGAFDLLGDRIAVVHAKDLGADGRPCAAGKGIVPWDRFVGLLGGVGFAGPLILHGLNEAEVPGSVAFLRERIAG